MPFDVNPDRIRSVGRGAQARGMRLPIITGPPAAMTPQACLVGAVLVVSG
jgi:hypothetical protein